MVKGRTNRHGFVLEYESVWDCSRRYFRGLLETDVKRVHLCSAQPCSCPGVAEVHISASSCIPRETAIVLEGYSAQPAYQRLYLAVSWTFQRTFEGIKRTLKYIGGCSISTTTRVSTDGAILSPVLDSDSETESEPAESHETCCADQVGQAHKGWP